MEFHISCHHTQNNCGVHRLEPDDTRSPNAVPNWVEHCKKTGCFVKQRKRVHPYEQRGKQPKVSTFLGCDHLEFDILFARKNAHRCDY